PRAGESEAGAFLRRVLVRGPSPKRSSKAKGHRRGHGPSSPSPPSSTLRNQGHVNPPHPLVGPRSIFRQEGAHHLAQLTEKSALPHHVAQAPRARCSEDIPRDPTPKGPIGELCFGLQLGEVLALGQ